MSKSDIEQDNEMSYEELQQRVIELETELEVLRDAMNAAKAGANDYSDSHRRAVKQRKQLEQLLVDSQNKAANENDMLVHIVNSLLEKAQKQKQNGKYTAANALYFFIKALGLDKNDNPFTEASEINKIQQAIIQGNENMANHIPFLVRYLRVYWRNVGIHYAVKSLLSLALEYELEGGAFAAIEVLKELSHFGEIDKNTICHIPREWIDENIKKNTSYETLKYGLEIAHKSNSPKYKNAYDASADLGIGKRTLEQYRNWHTKIQELSNGAEGVMADAMRNNEVFTSNAPKFKKLYKP